MEPYHVIVIGAGSGGLVCAAGGAMLGARVALVEKHKMGGDCLNTGCVPSKSIIRAAKLNYDAKRSEQFGLSLQTSPVNLKSVLDSVRKVIKKIEPHDSVERFRGLGVDVYQSSFHFKSPWEITDGGQILKAKRFVIATGSSPRVPNISGIETIPYLTSENVWDLEELPRRMVVLGGGPIGTELAQTFSRLGSEVTLVQNRDRLLPREDSEVSEALKKIFEREGIRICLGHEARKIRESSGGYEIILIHPEKGSETVGFDQILIATGRTPNIEGLQLETAGVKFSSQGILVDAYLRTKAKHIFACGDVAGHFLFTHTAAHQARTVLRNALFPGNSKIDYRVVPWSTFTDPEVARVGLNEAEAKKNNISYDVYRYSLSDLDRAICDREVDGFLKVLTPKGKDKILGVTLMASHGGDLLSELVLAMSQGIGLAKISKLIHIYPTLAEINQRLAGTYQSSRLTPKTKKWMQRYFRWRLG